MVTAQNYRLIRLAWRRIETYTGNILTNMADAVLAVDKTWNITVYNDATENKILKMTARLSQHIARSCQGLVNTR